MVLMPVTLIAAITADGFIAKSENHRSFNWTSPEDKQFYVQKIKEADALVMGSKTFNTFSRYPKGSTYVIYSRHPETINNPKPEVISVIPTNDDPPSLIAQLEKMGKTNIALCGGASIYTMFMAAGLVDTLLLTVEPVIFGQGVKLFDKDIETTLQLNTIHHLSSQTKVFEYQVKK